jgi:hypothetical protein
MKNGVPQRIDPAIEVFTSIQQRGWLPLCNIPGVGYEELVREFFANMRLQGKEDNQEPDETFVRGKHIDFGAKSINRILGIPEVEMCSYYEKLHHVTIEREEINHVLSGGVGSWTMTADKEYGRYLNKVEFTPKAKLWSAFMYNVLLPMKHDNHVTRNRLLCLYTLMKDELINVGLTIECEMRNMHDSKVVTLGFAKIITLLCQQAGVIMEGLTPIPEMKPIDKKYFNQWVFAPGRIKDSSKKKKHTSSSNEPSEPMMDLLRVINHKLDINHENDRKIHTLLMRQSSLAPLRYHDMIKQR